MVTLNFAYTAPINPAGASPVLTQAQVWKGLERKVRRAQEFVPVITSCEVLSEDKVDTGSRVVRQVNFQPGVGPKPSDVPVKETCLLFAPSRVDFRQEDGAVISNVISKGPDGELLMTYIFEVRRPDVPDTEADKVAELEATSWKMSKIAVEKSIETIRKFVEEGEIQ
jgi:hypothetical protein